MTTVLPFILNQTNLKDSQFLLSTISCNPNELDVLDSKTFLSKRIDFGLGSTLTFPNKLKLNFCMVDMVDMQEYDQKDDYKWLTYDEIVKFKFKRRIDKKLLLSKLRLLINPWLSNLLLTPTFKEADQLLLPRIFNGIELERVKAIVYTDFDCFVHECKNYPDYICVSYRGSLAYWTNETIPYKIDFMSQNRGTIYKYTCTADGNHTYQVVAAPLFKFWNHDHNLTANVKDSFIVDNVDTLVLEKVDGFIVKVFWSNDYNIWIVSSNSHVDASEAILHGSSKNAKMIFDECSTSPLSTLNYAKLNKHYCYIFEMVHPEVRLVTPYANCQLYHIATRDMTTLKEIPLFSPLTDIGIPKPRRFTHDELSDEKKCIDYVSKMHWTKGEGLVVCHEVKDGSFAFMRKKIKSPSYSREHITIESGPENSSNWRSKFLYEYLVDTWLNEEDNLLIKYHPDMVSIYNIFTTSLEELYQQVDKFILNNKQRRLHVKKMFYGTNLQDNFLAQNLIKKFIYKPDLQKDCKKILQGKYNFKFQYRETLVLHCQSQVLGKSVSYSDAAMAFQNDMIVKYVL